MSPVALGLDILLIGLLLTALAVGLRLSKQLKAMREGQAGFVAAVRELDTAALRAETALTALKAASENAHDELLARIETARALSRQLEAASAEIERKKAVEATATPPVQTLPRGLSRLDPRFLDERMAARRRSLEDELFEDEPPAVSRQAGAFRR